MDIYCPHHSCHPLRLVTVAVKENGHGPVGVYGGDVNWDKEGGSIVPQDMGAYLYPFCTLWQR